MYTMMYQYNMMYNMALLVYCVEEKLAQYGYNIVPVH